MSAGGHRGINFCNQPEAFDLPNLWDQHWDPIWEVAKDTGVTVNFHIGGGRIGEQIMGGLELGFRANFSRISSLLFVDNLRCISNLIHGGVCHRFPDVKFVSVESGVGMIPGALEAFDWQWRNGGVVTEHPEYDLLPSEYFRRQIYGCFWYERDSVTSALLAYPDNMMFETDFPHPTCQHPGPQTPAVEPSDLCRERALGVARRRAPQGPGLQCRGPLRSCSLNDIAERLRRWLTDELEQAVRIENLRRTSAGYSRENWLFDAAFDTGHLSLIARRDPAGSVLDTDRRIEATVLRALQKTDLPVPLLRWADLTGEKMGRPTLVMDLAPGLCDGFVLNGELPIEERLGLARHLYGLLARIHLVDWQSLGLGDLLEDPGPNAALRAVDHWECEMRRVQLEPEPELAVVIAWLRANAPISRSTVLVHGDFKPGNVLLEGDEVSVILDWETAHLGDPHEDLGWVTNPLRGR